MSKKQKSTVRTTLLILNKDMQVLFLMVELTVFATFKPYFEVLL